MNKLEKVKFVGQVFAYGAKAQLEQEWTIGMAASIGLMQGLKYKGDVKAGVKAGLATLAVLMVANGFNNVISNWDTIKSL